jgi:hypothetical protein
MNAQPTMCYMGFGSYKLALDEAVHHTDLKDKGFPHGSINQASGPYIIGAIRTNMSEGF